MEEVTLFMGSEVPSSPSRKSIYLHREDEAQQGDENRIKFHYQGENYSLELTKMKSNEVAERNLRILFQRKKGTRYGVNDQGYLAELPKNLSWSEKRRYNRPDEVEKVKKAINGAFDVLIALAKAAETNKNEIEVEAAVRFLFDKKRDAGVGRLNAKYYDVEKVEELNSIKKTVNDIELSVRLDQLNLQMLLRRKKGEKLVRNQSGRLVKVSRCWYNKQSGESSVRKVVQTLIGQLHVYAKTHKTHKFAIKELFAPDGAIARLSRVIYNGENITGGVFDRGWIQEDSELEKMLNDNISKKRDNLAYELARLELETDFDKKQTLKRDVEEAFMAYTYEEFRLAQHLGFDLERNRDGGSGGARYGYNRFHEKILVIKAEDEGPHGVNNPQWYAPLKRLFIAPRAIYRHNSEAVAEMNSWLMDRSFGLWTVPPTSLRYVESNKFVRGRVKHCSIQMFIPGCTTLQDHMNIPKNVRSIIKSRASLRRQFADDNEVENKWPQTQAELFGQHNFLIEDGDSHFENGLHKQYEQDPQDTTMNQVFKNGQVVVQENDKSNLEEKQPEDERVKEIREGVVETLFRKKGHHELLQHLFNTSKEGFDKSTTFKHDGGFSHPRKHPNSRAFLSLRFEHFFEVLPHFTEEFSPEGKARIVGKEDKLAQALMEKAVRDIESKIKPEVFDRFWSVPKNRKLLKQWIFESDFQRSKKLFQNQETEEKKLRLQIIQALQKAENEFLGVKMSKKLKKEDVFEEDQQDDVHVTGTVNRALSEHLRHIKQNLHTRIDSFRVLNAYLQEEKVEDLKNYLAEQSEHKGMRFLFVHARTSHEFNNALFYLNDDQLGDGFNEKMAQWQQREINEKKIPLRRNVNEPLSSRAIIEGFGEKFV